MHKPPLIMVVDDTPTDALILSRSLSRSGFHVQVASDGTSAVDMALRELPDLILMDMTMPGQDGLETCRILKKRPPTANIPVIFVTAHSDPDHVVPAFDVGGSDYVCKPIRIAEILARISVQLRLRAAEEDLEKRNADLERLSQQLAETNTELARQNRIDALTNLLNRRAWDESAQLEQERSERHRRVFGVLMIDVDSFKSFNDSQGHPAGDGCLRRVAQAIASTCRAIDVVGRYGGEEFVVLAPETPVGAAALLAERIRQSVWDLAIPHPASPPGRVTVSIGVSDGGGISLQQVVQQADTALYRAKKCGRNLVCTSDAGIAPAPSTRIRAGTEESARAEQPSDGTTCVLIVEDNHTNRMIYKGCLAPDGYRIIETENGQAALEAVARELPDVIIMDVMMPVMDGLECTRQLKADARTRGVPIIIVSARSDAAEIIEGLKAGADEYLTKPVRTTELAVRVRSMARLSRERQDLLRSYHLRAEQIRVFTILVDLCRCIGNAVTSEEVLEHALEAVAQVAMSRRVSIMLPDPSRTVLSIAKAKGLDAEIMARVRVPVGTAIAGRVFESREAIVVNTQADAARYEHQRESDYFASIPLLSTPLGTSGEILGVLNVTDRVESRPFETRELESIGLVANIVGSALQTLRARSSRDEARDMIVIALAKLAEHRDNDTARHVDRVTRYALVLAESLRRRGVFDGQITDDFIHDLGRAVPLHDIGKVAIPDYILRKPAQLSVDEMAQMRTHAEIGANTLKPILESVPDAGFLRMAEGVIRSHHEWYDGSGYPRGLRGEAIPLAARIAAVADVFDALTTDRVYRKALSRDESFAIIERSRGTQFDPLIVDAFLELREEFQRLATELADVTKPQPAPTASLNSQTARVAECGGGADASEPIAPRCAIDVETALKNLGGDRTLLTGAMRELLRTLPQLRDELRCAFASEDTSDLRAAARSLMGAAAKVGAQPLRGVAERLATRIHSRSLTTPDPMLAEVTEHLDGLDEFARAWLRQ